MATPTFDGFKKSEFHELAGSSWRNRERLGGMLAMSLRQVRKRSYQSYGVSRRLELHLADKHDYLFRSAQPYGKLFISSNAELAFGFYIEAPLASTRKSDPKKFVQWQRLKHKLQTEPPLGDMLVAAMHEHELSLTDYFSLQDDPARPYGGALAGCFAFRDGRLQVCEAKDRQWHNISVEQFVERITEPPRADVWLDLHIFKTMNEDTAVKLGPSVVQPIFSVLNALAPLYEATLPE